MAIGPSLPPAGPQLPSRPSAPASDSDSDDYSPSLPPDMLAARDAPRAPVGPQLPGSDALRVFESIASTSGPKPVLGPALPPRSYVAPPPPRARAPLSHAYSDDEDGPMPLPAHLAQTESNDGVRAFREREAREAEKLRGKTDDKGKLKREEWMLVPPKEGGLTASRVDTTKMKSRSFAAATPVAREDKSAPNLWTETPMERQQRLEDEQSGKRKRAEISNGGGGTEEVITDEMRRKRRRDDELREEVERHNKSSRSRTLLDTHEVKKTSAVDEKGGSGIWDRDRDMSVTGRLYDQGKRAEVVKQAKELGGRFGGGSYL